jgi:hypothetical protein
VEGTRGRKPRIPVSACCLAKQTEESEQSDIVEIARQLSLLYLTIQISVLMLLKLMSMPATQNKLFNKTFLFMQDIHTESGERFYSDIFY